MAGLVQTRSTMPLPTLMATGMAQPFLWPSGPLRLLLLVSRLLAPRAVTRFKVVPATTRSSAAMVTMTCSVVRGRTRSTTTPSVRPPPGGGQRDFIHDFQHGVD